MFAQNRPTRSVRLRLASGVLLAAMLATSIASCSTGVSAPVPVAEPHAVVSAAPKTTTATAPEPEPTVKPRDTRTLAGASAEVMEMLPDDSAATAAVARLRSLVDKELERLVTEEVSSDLRLLWMDTMLAMLNSDDASRYEENAAAFYAYGSRVQSEGRKHGLITIERP